MAAISPSTELLSMKTLFFRAHLCAAFFIFFLMTVFSNLLGALSSNHSTLDFVGLACGLLGLALTTFGSYANIVAFREKATTLAEYISDIEKAWDQATDELEQFEQSSRQ
ncbi:hypothetical protein [Nocardia sp. SC052]|uniref:hypothetical protein n=1 Tax=Nocardia sichangensis TaxID=3385975 RepID=UPI00399F6AC6